MTPARLRRAAKKSGVEVVGEFLVGKTRALLGGFDGQNTGKTWAKPWLSLLF